MLEIDLLTFEEAIKLAFGRIQDEGVVSSWKDALSSNILENGISKLLEIPTYGCFIDKRNCKVKDTKKAMDKILASGGETGWYYGDWLWGIRGFIDRIVGGVGLRRGRKNTKTISAGDSLDFWRVLYANKEEKRLLLYAEMKLPGEAWLEFEIKNNTLYQTATFRPLGIWGRIYWYSVLPFHGLIFPGMIKGLSS
jgi:hypothetical protein